MKRKCNCYSYLVALSATIGVNENLIFNSYSNYDNEDFYEILKICKNNARSKYMKKN